MTNVANDNVTCEKRYFEGVRYFTQSNQHCSNFQENELNPSLELDLIFVTTYKHPGFISSNSRSTTSTGKSRNALTWNLNSRQEYWKWIEDISGKMYFIIS